VLGGGRYDGLIENLGGPATPAVGWAAGIERLAMLIDAPVEKRDIVAVLPDKRELEGEALAVAARLRRAGVRCWTSFGGNPKKLPSKARTAGVHANLFVLQADETGRCFNFVSVSDHLEVAELRESIEAVLGRERFGNFSHFKADKAD